MYNPQDQTVYIVDESSMWQFYEQFRWLAISWDTPKTKISNLAFDKPSAFTNKTPWTGSYSTASLQYQPNHVYTNPTPTEFQTYFAEQKAQGRSAQDIYQNNPYLIKTITYTPPASEPTPDFTVAAVIPDVPTTYTWNVPFRSGLTDKQKEGITNMLTNRANANQTLNETDARNYAYAVGGTNWQQYLGKQPYEVLKKEIVESIVQTAQALSPLSGQYTAAPLAVPTAMAVSTTALVEKRDAGAIYLDDSTEQIVLGNYTEKVTLLGTLGQVGLGLLGFDLPGDIRDIYYRLTHRKESKDHPLATTLDVVGVLPLIGVLKYGDEVGALLKNFSKNIARGHALNKHLDEFIELGIKTEDDLERHIEQILQSPSDTKVLVRGRKAFWDDKTGTLVIIDPNNIDKGTTFRPPKGKKYFDEDVK